MRRSRAFKRGQWLSLLVAGMIGYLLGDWHAIALRTADLSASQNVALRFPEAKAAAALADLAADKPAGATSTIVLGDTSAALLSPNPMVLSPARQAAAQVPVQVALQAPMQVPVRVAMAEDVAPLPAPTTVPARRLAPAAAQPKPDAKPDAKPMAAVQAKSEKSAAVTDAARHGSRPGFMLNDAQIASIKTRLHLSPDQEQMWPAVEAALRNIAYAKARDGRRHGGADSTDVASLDPYGPEVQGLKSAAFPLIMSFSDEQRSEVRTLAHVMGLDQLASQF
jgi:hypothetical protein